MTATLIIIGILLAPAAILLALITAGYAFYHLNRLRRRHHHDRQQPLTDREVADALAPFGADISVWPSRAPKNGSAHE